MVQAIEALRTLGRKLATRVWPVLGFAACLVLFTLRIRLRRLFRGDILGCARAERMRSLAASLDFDYAPVARLEGIVGARGSA